MFGNNPKLKLVEANKSRRFDELNKLAQWAKQTTALTPEGKLAVGKYILERVATISEEAEPWQP